MKLLLDQNIKPISNYFSGSIHVSEIIPVIKEDFEIFSFAGNDDFTIVTFDEDFYELQLVKGYPPKIIDTFLANQDVGILEIY